MEKSEIMTIRIIKSAIFYSAFKEATDFDAIRKGYQWIWNKSYRILPEGPDESVWEEPNNRSENLTDKISLLIDNGADEEINQ